MYNNQNMLIISHNRRKSKPHPSTLGHKPGRDIGNPPIGGGRPSHTPVARTTYPEEHRDHIAPDNNLSTTLHYLLI